MTEARHYFNRWMITAWAALFIGLMIAAILATFGGGEKGIHLVIRSTAQTSFMLFTSAFVASPLLKLWPTGATRWLRANRRYIGVSFAVSHICHGAAIIALAVITSGASVEIPALIGGSLIYIIILAMAATSFDRTTKWLGQRAWRRLHSTGMYVLWAVFTLAYVGRAFNSILYVPFALVVVAAILLRIAARNRGLQRKAARA
jgi:methionine sulfoxide reductase heme-binding subunit